MGTTRGNCRVALECLAPPGVAALSKPEYLLEVDAIAVVDDVV
jgi:hypothetical protein